MSQRSLAETYLFRLVFIFYSNCQFEISFVKHSATPKNVHVFWLCENVTQICAQNVEPINTMSQRSLAETYLFRLVFIFYSNCYLFRENLLFDQHRPNFWIWKTLWTKSINGTFIALLMRVCGYKKNRRGSKVPIWQFLQWHF